MTPSIFHDLGLQLKAARTKRKSTQQALAKRLGRDPARISELERDLRNERHGRDRLALLLEICDALDLAPLLVPTSKVNSIREFLGHSQPKQTFPPPASTAFEDVFVALSDDEEK